MRDHPGIDADTGWGVPSHADEGLPGAPGEGAQLTPLQTGGDTGAPGPGGGHGGEGDDACVAGENLTEELDRMQVPGDDRVLYCHGTGSGRFVLVESDISSCFPHLDHPRDVFPTTGCDS